MKKRVSLSGLNKRGSEKYYILMSLILGLIVLAISLYFIFQEYFTEDELDWEACRQSIYLRSIAPNYHDITDLKDAMPLKCKTEVVEIDTAEPQEVYKKISDVVAAGWYLFGEGKYDIVPRSVWSKSEEKYCMVFARVHFTDNAQEEFDERVKSLSGVGSESGFSAYYRTTLRENSDETYQSYLPLVYYRIESVYHYLIYNSSSISFTPNDKDLLFVYSLTKNPGRLVFGYGFDVSTWKTFSVKEDEKYKSIRVIHPEELSKMGCTSFLTIPA